MIKKKLKPGSKYTYTYYASTYRFPKKLAKETIKLNPPNNCYKAHETFSTCQMCNKVVKK